MSPPGICELNGSRPLIEPQLSPRTEMAASATDYFIDFAKYSPQVIEAHDSISHAREHLRLARVSQLLVVTEAREVVGYVTQELLDEQRVMMAQQMGVGRQDMEVKDLMLPLHELKAIDFAWLINASGMSLVERLAKHRQTWALVVDTSSNAIRGMVSLTSTPKQLASSAVPTQPMDGFKILKALQK